MIGRGNPPVVKGMRRLVFLGKMDDEIPMKMSRFTEAQIMGVLRQAEGGMPVAGLCREQGISSETFYIYGRLSSCERFEVVSDR